MMTHNERGSRMIRIVNSVAVTSLLLVGLVNNVQAQEEKTVLGFKMNSLSGEEVDLAKYKGKAMLIVNVASRCGLTPQYAQLQEVHEEYADKGLAVLGFPCNQFGRQEPGTAKEISEFCSNEYGVTFDMFAKADVNGNDASPLYKYLTSLEADPVGSGSISWNFEKFIVDREGNVIARFSPRTKPDAPEVIAAIKKALGE